jgi:hypothetical protein
MPRYNSNEEKRLLSFMPRAVFEPAIPTSEQSEIMTTFRRAVPSSLTLIRYFFIRTAKGKKGKAISVTGREGP